MTTQDRPAKEMSTQERLKEASGRAAKCHDTCSDYSCVRMGCCTGHAGHEETRLREQLRREERQAELSALDGNT